MRTALMACLVLAGAACKKSPSISVVATEPDVATTVIDLAVDGHGVAWITASGRASAREVKTRNFKGSPSIEASSSDACCVALDGDAVYWLGSGHLWRSRRGSSQPSPVEAVDDVPKGLAIAGGTAYVATDTAVRRVQLKGGSSQVVFSASSGSHIDALAVSDGRVVIALSTELPKSDHVFGIEIWRLDGQSQQIGDANYGDTDGIAIDDAFVILGLDAGHIHRVIKQPLDGGARIPVTDGTLVTARGGTVFVTRTSGTFAVDRAGVARRIGPPSVLGRVLGTRLYGVFTMHASGSVLGAIPVR